MLGYTYCPQLDLQDISSLHAVWTCWAARQVLSRMLLARASYATGHAPCYALQKKLTSDRMSLRC